MIWAQVFDTLWESTTRQTLLFIDKSALKPPTFPPYSFSSIISLGRGAAQLGDFFPLLFTCQLTKILLSSTSTYFTATPGLIIKATPQSQIHPSSRAYKIKTTHSFSQSSPIHIGLCCIPIFPLLHWLIGGCRSSLEYHQLPITWFSLLK